MASPYSLDLRLRAIKFLKEGYPIKKISKYIDVSLSTVYNWILKYKVTGSVEPQKDWRKGYGHKIKDLDELKRYVDANLGKTAKEMAKDWNVCPTVMLKYLHKIGYSCKKKVSLIKSKGLKK